VQGDVSVQLTDQVTARFIQRLEDVDSDVAESYTKNTSTVAASFAF
jgi:hypothetical protein